MTRTVRRLLFAAFLLSGFAGLVDQVVWTRLAMAAFGVTAPTLSVVLSVFMAGLAVGSWAGGRWVGAIVRRTGWSAAWVYAAAEAVVGVGAIAVPGLLGVGSRALLSAGQSDSKAYLAGSAVAITAALLPWCLCMGATFPLMLAYLRERADGRRSSDGFGFLYAANVLGGMAGTLLTAVVLVELLGFRHTLWTAAAANVGAAAIAAWLGRRRPVGTVAAEPASLPAGDRGPRGAVVILFVTGLTSLALEVVWSRTFAGVLKTQVYSFAMIVFTYLAATFAGAAVYRWHVRRGRRPWPARHLLLGVAVAAFLPVMATDPRVTVQEFLGFDIDPASAVILLGSIVPLCGLLGYLTPSLVDGYGGGDPRRAGSAYAANVVGCILGPLLAGYGLLPAVGGRVATVVLGLGLAGLWAATSGGGRLRWPRWAGAGAIAAAAGCAAFVSRDLEEQLARSDPHAVVRRDEAASVVAMTIPYAGGKHLVVNGTGMTILTPITKYIAHLPLAVHAKQPPPRSMLVVCFGMGTTFRSGLSWGIDVTAVELVPSVPANFGFYFPDAAAVLADPHGRVVIDDGRRYLARCGRRFDVIAVDPPPPVTAAASSLLFSTDFYELAKQHLNPGGVVQMWYPLGADRTYDAVARSMMAAFPHVCCVRACDGDGRHLLGSMDPLDVPTTGAGWVARMPPRAVADLMEWARPGTDPAAYTARVASRPVPLPASADGDRVTDDRPFNEYYLLRQWAGRP